MMRWEFGRKPRRSIVGFRKSMESPISSSVNGSIRVMQATSVKMRTIPAPEIPYAGYRHENTDPFPDKGAA